MNICFFNIPESSGAAMIGGMERATSLIAAELRRRGHSVEFYFYEPPSRFHIPILSGFLPSPSKRSAAKRFCEFLKEHKIDVAVWFWGPWHVPFPLKNLPCPLVASWRFTPFWSKQTCTDYVIKKLRLRFAQRFIRCNPCRFLIWKIFRAYHTRAFFSYALRYSEKFILQSEEFFADFAPGEKFPEKVCAIPNIATYEAQDVAFESKKKELLWVGRVVYGSKRPDLMLQIWQRLQDRFPDWKLRFVGDGDYLHRLKKLSTSLGLKNVFFEGYKDPTPYYRSASIFCMTSTEEGFPNVLLEAQAFGCVPIACDALGAFHDIIKDGENGYLVPPFDLDAYAEKLAQLMSNSSLRESLARNGQESIAKFSAEAVGEKWEKLLQEVDRK